jgi:hypothetical protein
VTASRIGALIAAGVLATGCSSTAKPAPGGIIPIVVSPTPSAVATFRADLAGFVGDWNQHAGHMTIATDGAIRLTYQANTGTYPPPFPNLTLTVQNVTRGVVTAVVATSDFAPISVGTAFTLRLSDPGIVKLTFPDRTSSTWCDETQFAAGTCGA